jgi:hypothetical protein
MRLGEALKDYAHTHVLAEATLTRLGLTDEAAMITTDEDHNLTGVVVACHKGLVVFTVGSTQTLRASVHAWRDVSPPELTATTEEKLEALVMSVQVRMTHPQLALGTAEFDLGTVEWQMDSTEAAIDFWKACSEHAGVSG